MIDANGTPDEVTAAIRAHLPAPSGRLAAAGPGDAARLAAR